MIQVTRGGKGRPPLEGPKRGKKRSPLSKNAIITLLAIRQEKKRAGPRASIWRKGKDLGRGEEGTSITPHG